MQPFAMQEKLEMHWEIFLDFFSKPRISTGSCFNLCSNEVWPLKDWHFSFRS